MTFQEYVDTANTYWCAHPEQRLGQAFMNTLNWVNGRVYHALPQEYDVWEVTDASEDVFWDFFWFVEGSWKDG